MQGPRADPQALWKRRLREGRYLVQVHTGSEAEPWSPDCWLPIQALSPAGRGLSSTHRGSDVQGPPGSCEWPTGTARPSSHPSLVLWRHCSPLLFPELPPVWHLSSPVLVLQNGVSASWGPFPHPFPLLCHYIMPTWEGKSLQTALSCRQEVFSLRVVNLPRDGKGCTGHRHRTHQVLPGEFGIIVSMCCLV